MVCDRLMEEEAGKAGEGAAWKRGDEEESVEKDAFADVEVVLLVPRGALGARFKLVELRLLPRDRASTRPSR